MSPIADAFVTIASCDSTTVVALPLTDDEFAAVVRVCDEICRVANVGCMPQMFVQREPVPTPDRTTPWP